MKTFMRYLAMGKNDLLIELAFPAGMWLFVEIVVNTILFFDGTEVALGIGGVVAFGTMLLMELFTVGARFMVNLNLGVSMGRTRRFMLGTVLGESALHLIPCMGLCALLGWAGQGISMALGAQSYENILFMMPWWGWVVGFFGVMLIGFCGGMLLQVFGRKGFWVLWAVSMLAFVVPANSSKAAVQNAFEVLQMPLLILCGRPCASRSNNCGQAWSYDL